MQINEEEIIAVFELDDNSEYIFLKDNTIYKKNPKGIVSKIEKNEENIRIIQEQIGADLTDIVM